MNTTTAEPAWIDAALLRRFLAFLGPMLLSTVFQLISGTVSNAYLGQLLGVRAVATAAAVFPVTMVLLSIAAGLATGASVLVGQAKGAQDDERLREVVGTVLWGGFVLSVAVALLCAPAVPWVLRLMATPSDILDDSVHYMRVMLLGFPVIYTSLALASVLRATGNPGAQMQVLIVYCAVICIATPALMLGWGPLPETGASGAAWGTTLGMIAGLGWQLRHLSKPGHPLHPRGLVRHLHARPRILREVARLGMPSAVFVVTGSAADMAVISLVNAHGSVATAAWGAVLQAANFAAVPALAISATSSILSAQAVGAGDHGQLGRIVRCAVMVNLVVCGGIATMLALAGSVLLSLFVTQGEVVQVAASMLRFSVWAGVFIGLANILSGVMRSAGTVREPTAIYLGSIVLLMFPLAWLFERTMGLAGIWLAGPVTFAVALALQIAFFRGVWRHRPIRKLF